MIVVLANENEKKHSISLFAKASEYVKPQNTYLGRLTIQRSKSKGDSIGAWNVTHYSLSKNQQVGVRGILRVDRKFKSHGPQKFKPAYKKRAAVERVFSRLKNLVSLTRHNQRGLAKVTLHSQICSMIILLTARAAINTHNQAKTRSIRYFAN